MKDQLIALLQAHNTKEDGIYIPIAIEDYVEKLINKACIIPYILEGKIQAFIAYYNNDASKSHAFLSMILVGKELQGKGIGKLLIDFSIQELKNNGFQQYGLEVLKQNARAIAVYEKLGFKIKENRQELWLMEKDLTTH